MPRFVPLCVFLVYALFAPLALHAYGSETQWVDKGVSQALRAQLLDSKPWKKVAKSLSNFTPASAKPLSMKFTCAEKLDSAFTRELELRGAAVIGNKECPKILVWVGDETGLGYTLPELQKKFGPVESEQEAAGFLLAAGLSSNSDWYGAVIEENVYVMMVDKTCKGLGAKRRIYAISKDGAAKVVATVNEPAPVGAPCPGNDR